ncbi:MAG TPA: DUF927 domain-containing protein [Methylotenera sp.]|nr:DUF927 domain-containing protein [Methylotenera sp.]HPH06257.1 DUF927 domain-containing protein [Methylotenera sp.]HPN02289.1 DUF927 domain-containing protein [Methylotenera sp.]
MKYQHIHKSAIPYIVELLDSLGVQHKLAGKQLEFTNPKRHDTNFGSASINTKTGIFKDFAIDKCAGDLIAFVAYIKDIRQSEAAEFLESFLKQVENDPRCLVPVPAPIGPEAPQVKAMSDQSKPTRVIPIPSDAPPLLNTFGKLGVPEHDYIYHNENGQPVCHILRFKKTNGAKQFMPQTLHRNENSKLLWKAEGLPTPRPLYNLHLLTQRKDAPVLIVEGEKAADAAALLFPNHVVTTTMNGAQSPESSDLTPLLGREILIWPDNDESGTIYTNKLVKLLCDQDAVARISILQPIVDFPIYDMAKKPLLEPGFKPSEGWDAADALAEGWTADHIKLLLGNPNATEPVLIEKQNFTAGNFHANNSGVYQEKKDSDGKVHTNLVASSIIPIAKTRDEHGKNWGLLLEVANPLGEINEWAMPLDMLSGNGDACRQQLLNFGAKIFNKEAVNQFLMAAKPEALALCTEITGWHDNVYILPHKTFGHSEERVVIQNSSVEKRDDFKSSGTLDDWKLNVASKCVGNSRLILAVCISLAAPFLKPLAEENGGFHLRGASSSGKTKTLSVAASVWGGKQMVHSWRTTGNAIESLAIEHNDRAIMLDELAQVSSSEAGDVAYTLGNGQQKARSNRTGNVRSIARWRLLFLSTGEIGLAEHVASAGGRIKAGQEIRMLDIPSDAGAGLGVFENLHDVDTPQQFADILQEMSERYYGTAADALLSKLTSSNTELEEAVRSVKHIQGEFVRRLVPPTSHGQLFRAAARFGLVAGVGEYCSQIGILPWAKGEAFNAAEKCYLSWHDERGGSNASEEIHALIQVKSFFEQHGESRFTLMNPDLEDNIGQRTINRAGFRKVLDNGAMEYWVFTEVYNTQICAGFDPKLVTKVLVENDHLQLDTAGKPQVTKRLPGSATATRVYVFNASIIDGENEDSDVAIDS